MARIEGNVVDLGVVCIECVDLKFSSEFPKRCIKDCYGANTTYNAKEYKDR